MEERYMTFACDCGEFKEVKVKEEKHGNSR
jgi:hypothetical protein